MPAGRIVLRTGRIVGAKHAEVNGVPHGLMNAPAHLHEATKRSFCV